MKKKEPSHIRYRHKHFLLTAAIALLLWAASGYVFLSVPPTNLWVIGAFFLLMCGALFLTASLLLGNSRHGFLVVFILMGYLLLRLMQQDIVLNMILLVSLAITLEMYFRQRK
ncbi:MAG: hypothetical protein NUV98_02430 [Candidatus Roizmanbacteria bacterium]|nr:hypothetical protein [Candidatus Roizmanbacteria bacterium]